MKTSKRISHRHPLPTTITLLAAFVLLSACAVGPDFERPAASLSQHYDAQAEQQLGKPATPNAQRIDRAASSMVTGGQPSARPSSTK